MPSLVEVLRPWSWPRAAALTLMTIGVAGCSAESTRFSDNPNARVETTASIPAAQPAPAGRVESRPLPPVGAQAAPPPTPSRPETVAASQGMAGGGRGMASYAPSGPPTPAVDVTGSVAAAPKPAPSGHWTWDGGTPVTVAPGETVESISRRHGVPASAIMQANNLTPPGAIHPGQQLVIPRYSQSPVASAVAPATRAAAPASMRPAAVRSAPSSPAGNPGVHVVAPGETLSKISRLYGKTLGDIAKANNIQPSAKLNVGDRLVIPGVRTTLIKPKAGAAVVAQAKPAAPAAPKDAASEPPPSASVFAPVAEAPAAKDAAKSAEATGSLPKFRWPANGRVIAGFGPTTNGQHNDGINIALPENTPVKAAEDGVVAYAGNELKGYGNLVLVRHPNGYVTAYAHAKELLVKRGDQVKRGQVIGRSGQTGNVNAPQLHFEIRKGAAPLDPIKFLTGA
jgi:murein DD-endopeptidase MepM/ murein hydrolase activator NlpD